MKKPQETTRSGSRARYALPVIILAALLTVSSTARFPDQAIVERVSLESSVDGSGTLIRVHANREIPWFTLSQEDGPDAFRLTLLNTKLDPEAVVADASGSLTSLKVYEQGSRVFIEGILVTADLSVSLQADPSSFDLLLTISAEPVRSMAEESSQPAETPATPIAENIQDFAPSTAAAPDSTMATADVPDSMPSIADVPDSTMATADVPDPVPVVPHITDTTDITTQKAPTAAAPGHIVRVIDALEVSSQGDRKEYEGVRAETLPADTGLPILSEPSKAELKKTETADAEHSLSDVQRLFSSTLKKSTVTHEPNPEVVQSNTDRWRLDTIVLDAGHGGWDEGAFGKAGFLEKDLALIIALRVGRMIEEQLGIKVIYTRSDDRFIPVAERGKMANEADAKLFVSIHANYSANRQAHGTETYFLGVHRTDSAQVVMERENRVVQLEDDTKHYTQYDNAASVRGALAQSSFMRHSAWLAEAVQQQFTDVVKRRDRGVKQAGFYVLFGASMPSILIELGFLSNPSEEKFLSSTDGQTSMANAIFRAIQNFKLEYEKSLPVASQ